MGRLLRGGIGHKARGSASTDPSTFTQCKLDLPWVAASRIKSGGGQAANGDLLQQWTDASTNANHALNLPASGTQPTLDTTNGIYNASLDDRMTFTAITLTGDFTIWVWSYNTVLDVLVALGGSGGTDRNIILADDGTIGLNNGAGKSASYIDTPRPTGLALYRIRRSDTSFYVAFTGQAEAAMTVTGTPGTVVFDTVLAYRAAAAIDTFSADSQYLKWLVIMDESSSALTSGQRSAVENYIAGASL